MRERESEATKERVKGNEREGEGGCVRETTRERDNQRERERERERTREQG